MRLLFLFFLLIFIGCQTAPKNTRHNESSAEVQAALESVVEAVAGKNVSEEEMKRLTRQLRTDKEAQSAVQSITNALSQEKRVFKYCPDDGKRYAAHLTTCPDSNTLLLEVE